MVICFDLSFLSLVRMTSATLSLSFFLSFSSLPSSFSSLSLSTSCIFQGHGFDSTTKIVFFDLDSNKKSKDILKGFDKCFIARMGSSITNKTSCGTFLLIDSGNGYGCSFTT